MGLQPVLEQVTQLPPDALIKIMPKLELEVPKANASCGQLKMILYIQTKKIIMTKWLSLLC